MAIRAVASALAAVAFSAHAAPPTIAGCQVFPARNVWNTRVDNLPVHARSAAWIASMGTNRIHADWGNVVADYYGIPFTVVPGTQPLVPITFEPGGAPDESDPGPYPIPPDAPIEGGPAADPDSDRHVIVIENTNCLLYELFHAFVNGGGSSWTVYSAARWDLKSNTLRPIGWTSADAANLPIFAGLVRYDEAASGEITHAIRMTAASIYGLDPATSQRQWIWPASHWSGSGTNPDNPPMGARFRLKASFVIPESFTPEAKAILRAMKKYGMILADGGSNWFFSGTTDTRWSSATISNLNQQGPRGADFEAVDTAPLMISVTSGQAVQFATLPANYNRDGKSDILYRNDATGQVYRFFMNGFAIASGGTVLTEPDTAWNIVATGDFNRDAVTDILYRHAVTGQVSLLLMGPNGTPVSGTVLYAEPNAAWQIVHSPDLDSDGHADVLWWNSSTGQVYAMLMAGTSIVSQGFVYTEPNTNWRIVATGDFAASGKQNQLLWRNGVTGQVYLMTVSFAAGVFGQTGQHIYQEANANWKIIAAPDLDGDGKSDILWRNDVTGQVYGMLMNGPSIASAGFVYAEPNTAWKIVAFGDYNGDGRSDLLWRNEATGQVYMMHMNGLAIGPQAMVYHEPGTAWKIVGK